MRLPSKFDSPPSRPDLLVIAGEHSGDEHASHMIRDLLRNNPHWKVCAFGGLELEKAGAQLLWDMTHVSVVGLIEVLEHYFFFKDLFEKIIQWIRENRPHSICFVDYPGFNLRLAARLKKEGLSQKGGGEIALFYYIAPQIWAWKANRRFQMQETLNALGVILPFEVSCFSDTDLPTTFLGHPFLNQDSSKFSLKYDPEGPILLLPGSREAAIGHIFPILLKAFRKYLKKYPYEKALVIYPSPELRSILERSIQKSNLQDQIALTLNTENISGKAVLTSSGTMSLLCALTGIPGAIVYRTNLWTYVLGRILVKIDYLGIANILLNYPIYPEFIQHEAKPYLLGKTLEGLIHQPQKLQEAQKNGKELRAILASKESMNPGKWLDQQMRSISHPSIQD